MHFPGTRAHTSSQWSRWHRPCRLRRTLQPCTRPLMASGARVLRMKSSCLEGDCTAHQILIVADFTRKNFEATFDLAGNPCKSLFPCRFNGEFLLHLQLNYCWGEVIHRVFLYILQGTGFSSKVYMKTLYHLCPVV